MGTGQCLRRDDGRNEGPVSGGNCVLSGALECPADLPRPSLDTVGPLNWVRVGMASSLALLIPAEPVPGWDDEEVGNWDEL